jgi:hypothetical protein
VFRQSNAVRSREKTSFSFSLMKTARSWTSFERRPGAWGSGAVSEPSRALRPELLEHLVGAASEQHGVDRRAPAMMVRGTASSCTTQSRLPSGPAKWPSALTWSKVTILLICSSLPTLVTFPAADVEERSRAPTYR